MRATKRMANIMQKELELRILPLLEPKIYVHKDALKPLVEVNVKNIGSFPVYFSHIFYKFWERMDPEGNQMSNIQWVNRWIGKGDICEENIRFDFSILKGFSTADDVKRDGMASLELHFEDINRNEFTEFKDKIIMF